MITLLTSFVTNLEWLALKNLVLGNNISADIAGGQEVGNVTR